MQLQKKAAHSNTIKNAISLKRQSLNSRFVTYMIEIYKITIRQSDVQKLENWFSSFFKD